MQKHLHIIESLAWILSIIFTIFLLSIMFLISVGIYSTTKLSKYVILRPFTYKAIQSVSVDFYTSKFISNAPILYLRSIISWTNSSKSEATLNSYPALIAPSPAQITPPSPCTPLPTNTFANNVAHNVPDNILRNRSFWIFLINFWLFH